MCLHARRALKYEEITNLRREPHNTHTELSVRKCIHLCTPDGSPECITAIIICARNGGEARGVLEGGTCYIVITDYFIRDRLRCTRLGACELRLSKIFCFINS